ncbi:MAG: type III pantothenate kinase [Eubacteriales bacterium]|nr:type III pantothenate kinase [Eubacteriales bacterium]
MLLAIDMGNSNIKIGVVKDEEHIIEERVTTARDKTSMEYAMDIMAILTFHGIDKALIEGAILSSVVPPLTGTLSSAVRKVLGKQPMIVSNRLKMHIRLDAMQYPEKIGADLLAGLEAAYLHYSEPVIVVNMGTATTITVLARDRRYLGGVILPGLKVSLGSLSANTAQLPSISLESPGRVIANETVECMRSGILYGNAGQIDGIISRMEEELGERCSVVATGGLARFVVPLCRHKIVMDDKLLMKGLLALYRQNEKLPEKE